jgi:rhodanese-related sulfurtransferase
MTLGKNKRTQPIKNNISIILGVSIVLGVIVFIGVWASQETKLPATLPLEISVAQAREKRAQGAFILDVRTIEEWEEGHIPASTLIPLDELPSRFSEVPEDMEIVVVCRSGNRSQAGRDILLNAGYRQVSSMRGGLIEWEALGYPTESGP